MTRRTIRDFAKSLELNQRESILKPRDDAKRRPVAAPTDVPALVASLAERVAAEPEPPHGFDRIAAENPDVWRWVNDRCVTAGMFAIVDWWDETLRTFWETGKPVLAGRVGLRGAKSATICRALVYDGLFRERRLDPGVVGVILIMSARTEEATDRFVTLKAILSALGCESDSPVDPPPLPGGLGIKYVARQDGRSGGGVIRIVDSQGHAIEFRVQPAKKDAAIGFTMIGGFLDEVDMWKDRDSLVNPADVVIDLVMKRLTTQFDTAKLYIFSASYHAVSAHFRIIARGDTELQHVARLGEAGAVADRQARLDFANAYKLDDGRLREQGDPLSTNIPAWVTNPLAPVQKCYLLSESKVGHMLGLYGGRPHEARRPGGTADFIGLNDAILGARSPGDDGLLRYPGLSPEDPRSIDSTDGASWGQDVGALGRRRIF